MNIEPSANSLDDPSLAVLHLKDCNISVVEDLLRRYHLQLILLKDNQAITGSFWGDSEAGLVQNKLFARNDTPIHSILHETCHYICMTADRRKTLNTNANGTTEEENAVCYLQIILSDYFPRINKQRVMKDMDSWGYSFRLGSTKAWFENDANDAFEWLLRNKLISKNSVPTFMLRQ